VLLCSHIWEQNLGVYRDINRKKKRKQGSIRVQTVKFFEENDRHLLELAVRVVVLSRKKKLSSFITKKRGRWI
jgi:hypothetical protein